MAKFKKKPMEIEAYKIIDDLAEVDKIVLWCGGTLNWDEGEVLSISVKTPHGIVDAKESDWIIKDPDGAFYPCTDSVFKVTYEQIDW